MPDDPLPPLTELARALALMANDLTEYRFAHWRELPADDANRLESWEHSLRDQSANLITLGASHVLADALGDVGELRSATQQAQQVIAEVKELSAAVAVAAASVSLAAAVVAADATGDLSPVGRAAKDFYQAVRDAAKG